MSILTMADRMLASGAAFDVSPDWRDAFDEVVGALSKAMIVKIDNVASYSFEQGPDLKPVLMSLSGLRLPSEYVFCEYSAKETTGSEAASYVGSLLWTGSKDRWSPLVCSDSYSFPDNTSDLVCGVQFFEFSDGHFWMVPAYQITPVDQSGSALGYRSACDHTWMKSTSEKDVSDLFRSYVPAPLAVAFLNCRNVRKVEQVPRPKLSKRCEAMYGRPALRYYTLKIDPMKRVLEDEGHVSQNGLPKALHICRGHFKDYREKGLFGQQKGLYWWDAHVRGTAERGVVVKDYEAPVPNDGGSNE